eukprot:PhM_4_TR16403/c0_g1_i1/m.61768
MNTHLLTLLCIAMLMHFPAITACALSKSRMTANYAFTSSSKTGADVDPSYPGYLATTYAAATCTSATDYCSPSGTVTIAKQSSIMGTRYITITKVDIISPSNPGTRFDLSTIETVDNGCKLFATSSFDGLGSIEMEVTMASGHTTGCRWQMLPSADNAFTYALRTHDTGTQFATKAREIHTTLPEYEVTIYYKETLTCNANLRDTSEASIIQSGIANEDWGYWTGTMCTECNTGWYAGRGTCSVPAGMLLDNVPQGTVYRYAYSTLTTSGNTIQMPTITRSGDPYDAAFGSMYISKFDAVYHLCGL